MIIFLIIGVGFGFIGALWTMIEGLYLILDRNHKYRTPFRILLHLHLNALKEQEKQYEQRRVITNREQFTKKEILIDPKAPWKH